MPDETHPYRISIGPDPHWLPGFPDRPLLDTQAIRWFRHKLNQYPTLQLRLEVCREGQWTPVRLTDQPAASSEQRALERSWRSS